MLCMGRRKEGTSSFGGAGTLEFVITSLTPFPFLLVGRPRSLHAFNGRADADAGGGFPPLLVLLLVNI